MSASRAASTVKEKQKRNMIRVAAEVVRESCRILIREATSISLAVDECDTRKIIRVRCDTPGPPYQWDGAICICKKLYGITGDISYELKDDHAVHNRRLFEQSLQAFYMPLKPHVKRQYTKKGRGIMADLSPIVLMQPAAAQWQPVAPPCQPAPSQWQPVAPHCKQMAKRTHWQKEKELQLQMYELIAILMISQTL